MDTATLIRLVQQCRTIAFFEGGGQTHGDMSVVMPLLTAALRDENPEEIKKAIFRYEPPKK